MICLARVIAKPNWVRIWLDWLGPDCTSISSPDPSKKRENHLPAQKLSNLQTFQIQKICEQWNNLSQKGLDLIIFLCWKHILELLSSPDMVCNSRTWCRGQRSLELCVGSRMTLAVPGPAAVCRHLHHASPRSQMSWRSVLKSAAVILHTAIIKR